MMQSEQSKGFPVNEANVRQLGEAVAAMKLFMSAGAAELGERLATTMQDIVDGINNATRP